MVADNETISKDQMKLTILKAGQACVQGYVIYPWAITIVSLPK